MLRSSVGIKKALRWLSQGVFPRGAGSTSVMIHGARQNQNVIILAHTTHYAEHLVKEAPYNATAKTWLQPLHGNRYPVLIDHFMVQMICNEAYIELRKKDNIINNLIKEKKKLQRKLDKLT